MIGGLMLCGIGFGCAMFSVKTKDTNMKELMGLLSLFGMLVGGFLIFLSAVGR